MGLSFITLSILTTGIILLVTWVYRYLKVTYSLLSRLNVAGPKPVWIFGNAADFKDKHPLDVFKTWRKKFGDVYGFYEGFRAGIVINSPEFSKMILSNHFDKFNIRTPYLPFTYFPDDQSLIKSVGEKWKKQRGIISKTLNFTGSMQQVVGKVQQATSHLLQSLEQNRLSSPQGFDISELINRCTVDTNAAVVIGLDLEEQSSDLQVALQYSKAFKNAAAADNPLTGIARLYPKITPFLQLFDTQHRELHNQMKSIVTKQVERLKSSKAENNNDEADKSSSSMLAHMLQSSMNFRFHDGTRDKRPLTDEEVTVNVMQLFSETFQTLVNCVSFIIYELAMNTEQQDKVYQEIASICSVGEGEITLSELQSLTYLEMFVYETLRLHPVAPGISRTCAEDCTINGVHFRKGMVVRLMTCTLYDDAEIYPEPEIFNPERFSKENKMARHPYAFLPFGQGPRSCPGNKLAMMEIKMTILRILQKYVIQRCEQTEVPIKTALRPSLCPANGVHVKLIPRDH